MKPIPARPLYVIHARYPLPEQFKLAAEFRQMLHHLSAEADVVHFSLRGQETADTTGLPDVRVVEVAPTISRASPLDIALKSLLLYARLPFTAAYLRKLAPGVVYLSEALPMYGFLLRLLSSCKVAITFGDRHVHNRLAGRRWGKPILSLVEWLEQFELTRVDGVFTRGRHCGDVPRRYGAADERVVTVYDAPDLSDFAPRDMAALRAKLGFSTQDIVVFYHGIMHAGKGLDLLVEWVAALHREDRRYCLLMVGSGPEEERLRQQAADAGMGNRAVFTGWLPTMHEVGDYCNVADLSVGMRRGIEANLIAISGALYHSMACGVVTLAPDMPGMTEIIQHGVNGFLFKADDGDDFKGLLRRLTSDRAAWRTIQERALQDVAEKYSVNAAAKAYAAAIRHFAQLPRL